jgi:hypothetical protein
MLEGLSNNYILFDLFIGVILYILAAFIGAILKRNQTIITPCIFGLMYGSYLSRHLFQVIGV